MVDVKQTERLFEKAKSDAVFIKLITDEGMWDESGTSLEDFKLDSSAALFFAYSYCCYLIGKHGSDWRKFL